jgi:hypothetical protein
MLGKCRFAVVVLGCGLLVVATGCALPQSRGDRSSDDQRSLSVSQLFPWLKSRPDRGTDSDNRVAESADDSSITASNPELLPWRGRLKSHRLAARMVRERESDADKASVDTASATPTGTASAVLFEASSPEPSETQKPKTTPTPSAKAEELQFPASIGSLPESNRPDLVVD